MLQIPDVILAWSVAPWAMWTWSRVLLTCALIGLCVVMFAAWVTLRRLRKSHTDLSYNLEAAADERRRAVQALRESEVLYYSLVETLPQNILRKDLDGAFTFANRRFCAELGRSLDQILGRTDFDFYPRELAEKYRRDDRRVIESGQVLDVVEQHVTTHGEKLYVQVMKSPILADDGRPIGIQGIFWDVTARIRAEEQLKEQNVTLQELAHSEHQAHEALKQAQSRLVQTEKLASLGQLVAGVAHEINNPLSFVSNNVAVLERDLGDLLALIDIYREGDRNLAEARPELAARVADLDERIDLDYSLSNLPRLIDRTREGLRRIERIVKELRLFARVDEGDWNEVDLNPGIESSINIIKGYARKKGVKVSMNLGALPVIRCRAARIHQVIVNLLTNAIDACGEDGKVTVQTTAESAALGIRIDVRDNGCGMDPGTRDHIFDPFFTTKPVGQGTGLGLSISYGIIQEHDGRIEVQSAPGEGSCFSVHLPLEPRRKPAASLADMIPGLDTSRDTIPDVDPPVASPAVAAVGSSPSEGPASGTAPGELPP
ncbi:sensor histidine kinase [Aquisphaera insulae]|uniref:sensor histidine kinase n=1 Tax=Aquisphaera insulae TaxID=2712864 RepID=UPI0013E9D752|nr:ATP-binding protein [Aquisphaera insulae]